MNFASWVILGIVIVIVGLAIKATFFKKSKGGCCDTGDKYSSKKSCCESKGNDRFKIDTSAACDGSDFDIKFSSGACGSCTACHDSATARNAVQPIIKPAQ